MNLKHYSQVFIIQYQLNVTCNVHQQRKKMVRKHFFIIVALHLNTFTMIKP